MQQNLIHSIRRNDWPERLSELLGSWRTRPFKWGEADCVYFARDTLAKITTKDWNILEIPPYTSAREARRALRDSGFRDLPDLLTQLLGCPVAPAMARRGDLLLVNAHYQSIASRKIPKKIKTRTFPHAMAVCGGEHAFAPGPHGLAALPMSHACLCWRI